MINCGSRVQKGKEEEPSRPSWEVKEKQDVIAEYIEQNENHTPWDGPGWVKVSIIFLYLSSTS